VAGEGAKTIAKRNVLAVEGEDDRLFFEALARYVGVVDVQIEPVGGKNQFKNKLPALLRMPGFFETDRTSRVRHLAIVRDKDEDNAFESIANTVTRAGLVAPASPGSFSEGSPRVGIFIMPGEGVFGTMLEDLCLETVRDRPAMACVRLFHECVRGLSDPPQNPSKAKCQAFLAAQTVIVNSIGLGAQRGYWDFGSPVLGALKESLGQMK